MYKGFEEYSSRSTTFCYLISIWVHLLKALKIFFNWLFYKIKKKKVYNTFMENIKSYQKKLFHLV